MKNMFKRNRAITLIALIITIVILIILAGVVISLSLGNNGLFNKAQEAKEKYTNAQGYEETEIARVSNEIDGYVGYSRTGGSNINYSLSEQDTGLKWIDGSKIYSQVIDLGTSFNIKKQEFVEISADKTPDNINMTINGILYIVDTVNRDFLCDPCQVGLRNGKLKFYALDSWSAESNKNIYLYIEYTKSN